MKVAILDGSRDMTGALRSILAGIRPLREDFEFHLLLPRGSPAVPLARSSGFRVKELRLISPSRRSILTSFIPGLAADVVDLWRYLDAEGIRLVHHNDLYQLAGFPLRVLRPASRLVVHLRLLQTSYMGPVFPLLRGLNLILADRLLAVSEAVQEDWPRDPRLQLVPDGLDPPSLKALEIGEAGEVVGHGSEEGGRIRILYLGNFIPGKGQDAALEALSLARRKNPYLELTFTGGTLGSTRAATFREELRAMATKLGLEESVRFQDRTDDIWELYARSDIVLMLSESESFSMVVLEGMLSGKPVISSDCGGPRDLIRDGVTGFLVPVQNPGAAADRILRLAEDPSLRQALGRRGREVASARHSAVSLSQRLRAIYRSLAKEIGVSER